MNEREFSQQILEEVRDESHAMALNFHVLDIYNRS